MHMKQLKRKDLRLSSALIRFDECCKEKKK